MKQKQNDRAFTQEKGGRSPAGRRCRSFSATQRTPRKSNRSRSASGGARTGYAGRADPRRSAQAFVPGAGAKRPHDADKQGKQKKFKKGGRSKNPVKIIFLGGVGEIGKNMTAIEYGNDIIIIDAGLTFPDEELPGIDLVIPDISYLVANKNKVRGLLITHGHEDHVGGIPYLLKEINMPVYGTKLTLALADNKLREHRLNKVQMNTVKPGDKVKLGCFTVEFINVNHSIAGSVALCIDTPNGKIFHSGDFKIV